MAAPIPNAYRLLLSRIFAQAEQEGYGIARGAGFEAFPGMEDAAADRIEQLSEEVVS